MSLDQSNILYVGKLSQLIFFSLLDNVNSNIHQFLFLYISSRYLSVIYTMSPTDFKQLQCISKSHAIIMD